jgi:hypothetical protein
MQRPAAEVQDVFVSGLLHDIGHVGLSDGLLGATVSGMTADDKALYVRHCVLGEQALLALEDMQAVVSNVRSHHERHDGRGFPEGLSGDAIPLGARILAVADTFDDLQSGHLTLAKLTAAEARLFVERGRGTQFEASVVDAFAEVTRAPAVPTPFVELSPQDLKPGMALARDLCSSDGMVLLTAGHVLSADLIRRVIAHTERHNLTTLIAVRTGFAAEPA